MLVDIQSLQVKLKHIDEPIVIKFYEDEENASFSSQLHSFVQELTVSLPKRIILQEQTSIESPIRPRFDISYKQISNIHYACLPTGPEQRPFFEALIGRVFRPIVNEVWVQRLSEINQSVELYLFIASDCPNCPIIVSEVLRLAQVSPLVHVWLFDVQQFPAMADRFKVRSVPHLIIDQGMSFVGQVQASQIVEKLLMQDTEIYQRDLLKSLLDSQRLSEAIQFVEQPGHSKYFFILWQASTTSLRMGLMLVAEKLLSKRKEILHDIVESLIALLAASDASLRGDTADLLGQIQHPLAREPLRALQYDSNPDVVDIAKEALMRIDGTNQN